MSCVYARFRSVLSWRAACKIYREVERVPADEDLFRTGEQIDLAPDSVRPWTAGEGTGDWRLARDA